MKNILTFIVVILLCISLSSCKKILDITPNGRTTLKDIFSNEQETEAYLNTVYSYIPAYFDSYQQWNFLAGCTDDGVDAGAQNNSSIAAWWLSGTLTPSYNPLTFGHANTNLDHYASFWSGIRAANEFLANIDKANVPNMSDKSRFKAEAHILRAFYYFELIKQFGPMPIEDKTYGPSFSYTSLKRPVFQDDIDFIVKDCDTAIANPNLPLRITQNGLRGRFSKAVAYALKSRALLYNASPLWNPDNDIVKWQAAAGASKEALSVLTQGGLYALAPDYGTYFLNKQDFSTDPKDKETIYESEFTLPLNTVAPPSKTGHYKIGVTPSQELVDAYGMQATGEAAITGYSDADHLHPIINQSSGYDPEHPYLGRDPRFYATVFYNGAVYDTINGPSHIETYDGGADELKKTPQTGGFTHSGYYLKKYVDPTLNVNQTSNARFRVFRLAEIYLNYAEAENEAVGPTADVYKAINTVRQRAHMPDLPDGLTKDQMRTRIRNEDRVEFPFEEHRFWDVRRWKILDQTGKVATGMEIIKNPGNTFTYKRFVTLPPRVAWQDKYLIFPIPLKDASIIPNFQNPGW